MSQAPYVIPASRPETESEVDGLLSGKSDDLVLDGCDAIESVIAGLRERGFSWFVGHTPTERQLTSHYDGDLRCEHAAPTVRIIHRAPTADGSHCAVYFSPIGDGCLVRVQRGEWRYQSGGGNDWHALPEGGIVCIMVQYQVAQ